MTYDPSRLDYYKNVGYIVEALTKLPNAQYVRFGKENGFMDKQLTCIKVVGNRGGHSFEFIQKIPDEQIQSLDDPSVLVDYITKMYKEAMRK